MSPNFLLFKMGEMRLRNIKNLGVFNLQWVLIFSLIKDAFLMGYTASNSSVDSATENSRECKQIVSTPYGVFHSPNYPERYPRYSRCQYVVQRYSSDVCEVKLTLNVFDVARMTFTECSEDFLELQDQEKRYRICGDFPPGSKKFVRFPYDSDQLIFNFQSTFHTKKGFEILVKQMAFSCLSYPRTTPAPTKAPQPCSETLKGRTGRLVFPLNKTPANSCTYHIHRSEVRACLLRLDFVTFEVLNTGGCEKDHVLLPDGQKLCGILGGNQKFLQFPEDSDELLIISHGKNNHFDIQLTQLPGPCESSALSSNQTGTTAALKKGRQLK